MKLVIVTGLSGAGRTRALRCLEDMNWYCVDNMPPILISKFTEMCIQSQGKLSKVAMVVDVRSGDAFSKIGEEIEALKQMDCNYEILFLDATDEVIISRYKETRRMHPMSPMGRTLDGIAKEREILKDIKSHATHIVDTSKLTPQQLKKCMRDLFFEENETTGITIDILSFGFKYGIPLDSDLVFDVRFLPNPFYVTRLKPLTGFDREVEDYIMQYDQSNVFCNKLIDMVRFLMPYYVEEGKGNLVISIGCTGGRHRSVTIARILNNALENEFICHINHRDINKR